MLTKPFADGWASCFIKVQWALDATFLPCKGVGHQCNEKKNSPDFCEYCWNILIPSDQTNYIIGMCQYRNLYIIFGLWTNKQRKSRLQPITIFTELLIEYTSTFVVLEHVHHLVTELKNLIFGFEWTAIKHFLTHH